MMQQNSLMHFVYLVECKDRTLYCGYTNDLAKRIAAHNSGKGARYTRGRRPVELVYSEKFRAKGRAMQREIEIKKLTRTQKKSLIKGKSK